MTPAEQLAHHIERLRPDHAAPAPATGPERVRVVATDPTLNHHRRARSVDAVARSCVRPTRSPARPTCTPPTGRWPSAPTPRPSASETS